MSKIVLVACCCSSMSAAIAAADLNCLNGFGIETQTEKGAPVHAIIRIHQDEYALPSARIMDVAYGVWPSSQQVSPDGMAACGEIFAGVSARCRSPCCFAASTNIFVEAAFSCLKPSLCVLL